MTSQNRGGKKKPKQRKQKSKKKSDDVEEQYLEDITGSQGNDSGHPPAHENETDHQPAPSEPLPPDDVTGNDKESGQENEYDHPPAHENETDHQSASSEESQPLPPDALYFKNTEFTQKCKIQSKCFVSKTVQLLKKPKFQPELEWFENHPQFCHFFHMPDEPNLKLLGMWMLLLRTIPLHEEEDTSWFAVNGVPIRYSLREHALISGLDCHAYPPKYKKIGSFAFVDRHFNKRSEITMRSVKEKLVSMSACGDRLRMAVLYFLGTILRAKARYNAPFDSFILRVANDVELTKTFPWGRLTFDDALGSITRVMKLLKGKPKKNVNFPGFIIPLEVLAFECIPALNTRYREGVDGCSSKCPRMCKKRFQNNSMRGYPLEDLYHTLGETKVINSVLVPTINEEPLMASITEEEPDYENEEGPSNLWSTWLTVKEKPIFWQELYELDVAAREFTDKKAKGPQVEEASSPNHGLEDVLKGFEERLMGSLSEVCVTVKKMDKRLGVMEKSHKILKRMFKKMKVEKRLISLERRLLKRTKKQDKMEERLDAIENETKRKENEDSDPFEYQGGFDWNMDRSEKKGEEEKPEEEAQKKDKGSEEADKEGGVEVGIKPRVDAEADTEPEVEEEIGVEAEEEGGVEVEIEPRVDAEADTEPEVEEEIGVEAEEEGGVEVETEIRVDSETEEEKENKVEEARIDAEEDEEKEDEKEEPETALKTAEKEAEKESETAPETAEKEAEKESETAPETAEKEAENESPTPPRPRGRTKAEAARRSSGNWKSPSKRLVLSWDDEEGDKYTEEEKQALWILSICKTNGVDEGASAVDEGAPVNETAMDKGAEGSLGLPGPIGVKHRPKAVAVQKDDPKPRGRPRKTSDPKKFTTPEQRTRTRSQWISSPYTEADTDEIEGRKKKPRTEA